MDNENERERGLYLILLDQFEATGGLRERATQGVVTDIVFAVAFESLCQGFEGDLMLKRAKPLIVLIVSIQPESGDEDSLSRWTNVSLRRWLPSLVLPDCLHRLRVERSSFVSLLGHVAQSNSEVQIVRVLSEFAVQLEELPFVILVAEDLLQPTGLDERLDEGQTLAKKGLEAMQSDVHRFVQLLREIALSQKAHQRVDPLTELFALLLIHSHSLSGLLNVRGQFVDSTEHRNGLRDGGHRHGHHVPREERRSFHDVPE